ncbi:MAG: hypothetical protein GSR84_03250 [Desulfurococcales archaeon]|nr:hypothetical protein [Desulfurococcales archaeon]
MSLEGKQYRLVLRKTARGPVIQFRSSSPETRESTLIRMGGKKASEIFEEMIRVLDKHGYITEKNEEKETYKAYRLKQEIGPVVGGYLVLIRRSRDPTAWIPYFEDFITEKYKGAHQLLTHALSLGIELSKAYPPPERVRMQLSPKVLDSISAGFKVAVRKLWRIREE